MYQVSAPILYEEPIVQNIGLFFLGVEQPITGRNEPDGQADIASQSKMREENETEIAQSIPYHKRQLLDIVKKINIIRASSSTPLDKCYLEHPYDAYLNRASQLHDAKCDRLARGEIEGWILAQSLVERLGEQSTIKYGWESAFPLISFRRLTTITLGLWDDGRWETYQDRAHTRLKRDFDREMEDEYRACRGLPSNLDDAGEEGDGTDEGDNAVKDVSASAYGCCEEILAAFFFRTLGHQAVDVCQNTNLGLRMFDKRFIHANIAYQYDDSHLRPVQGLRVLHGCPDPGYEDESYGDFVYAGPTRTFSEYSQAAYPHRFKAGQLHKLHIGRFDRSMSAYVKRHPDRLPDRCHTDMTFSLDLCLLPAVDGADVMPVEAQFRTQIEKTQTSMDYLIQKEKEESDAFGGSAAADPWRSRDCREALLSRMIPLNIYIGDDIPPCPGCGLKE
jgi:hypothetical protein